MSVITDPWGITKDNYSTEVDSPEYERASSADSIVPSATELEKSRVDVKVQLLAEPAGQYMKHRLYEVIDMKRGQSVLRRYSDFAWLNDHLVTKLYTFRLLPPLPPKRLAVVSDEGFLDRRARGLSRYSSAILSHHVLKSDSTVLAFFSAESLDRQKLLADNAQSDESLRPLTPQQEVQVPANLEDKLASLKTVVLAMANIWTKICQAAERTANRAALQAQDFEKVREGLEQVTHLAYLESKAQQSVVISSKHFDAHAKNLQSLASIRSTTTLERLKAHRELFSACRDLFVRWQKYSPDEVDRLRSRIASSEKKIEKLKGEQKQPNWQAEVEKLNAAILQDNENIETLVRRRLRIRTFDWFVVHLS